MFHKKVVQAICEIVYSMNVSKYICVSNLPSIPLINGLLIGRFVKNTSGLRVDQLLAFGGSNHTLLINS